MPLTVKTTPCKSCQALMVWMITGTAGTIPVDADTVDEATLEWGQGKWGMTPVFDPDEHTAHFATCPDADEHRRSRR